MENWERKECVCMYAQMSVCMYVFQRLKKKEAKTEEFESPRIRTEEL